MKPRDDILETMSPEEVKRNGRKPLLPEGSPVKKVKGGKGKTRWTKARMSSDTTRVDKASSRLNKDLPGP